MGRMIGIDLGTTNCCMAVLEGNRAQVIPLQDGGRTMPSIAAWTDDGEILVGRPAARQAALNPQHTVYGAKRLIGRKLDDPRIRRWQELVPYRIVGADNGDAWVEIDGHKHSPEEISALLLKELKKHAEVFLGDEVSAATITVPAYFNDRQRQATRNAGEIAGLSVEHVLNEPTAAALAFGASRGEDGLLAVFDLGGGTFDITILEKSGSLFEVRSTHGDTFLGGEDFDQLISEHMVRHFLTQTKYDLTTNAGAMQRVKEAAEEAKRALSGSESVTITLPFLAEWGKDPLHLELKSFSRAQLEALGVTLLERLEEPCLKALKGSRMQPEDISRVLLAGGMTRMPAVQRKVQQIFGRRPEHTINPDEIVAIGAAAHCGILTGDLEGVTLFDVTPHSLGVKVMDDEMRFLIAKNASVPISEERSFTTTYDYQDEVRIEVFQGESNKTSENTPLGQFVLKELPRQKRGEIEIVVTFLLDADGILQVSAREKASGQEATIEIAPSGGLSGEALEELKRTHQRA